MSQPDSPTHPRPPRRSRLDTRLPSPVVGLFEERGLYGTDDDPHTPNKVLRRSVRPSFFLSRGPVSPSYSHKPSLLYLPTPLFSSVSPTVVVRQRFPMGRGNPRSRGTLGAGLGLKSYVVPTTKSGFLQAPYHRGSGSRDSLTTMDLTQYRGESRSQRVDVLRLLRWTGRTERSNRLLDQFRTGIRGWSRTTFLAPNCGGSPESSGRKLRGETGAKGLLGPVRNGERILSQRRNFFLYGRRVC